MLTKYGKRPIADGRVAPWSCHEAPDALHESCTAHRHIATAGGVVLERGIAHRYILHASRIDAERVIADGNVLATCVICEGGGAHRYILETGWCFC